MQFIQKWDQRTSQFCLVHSYNLYQAKISRWISKTGDGPFYLLIGSVLFMCDGFRGELFLTETLKAFAIELPLYLFLKNFFKRERPQNLPSFITPSDRVITSYSIHYTKLYEPKIRSALSFSASAGSLIETPGRFGKPVRSLTITRRTSHA